MELTIKNGDYTKEAEVLVEIKTTETKENIVSVNEEMILKTIEALNERKTQAIALIDSEIAINNDMLTQIRSVDRKSAVTEVKA